MSASSAKRVTRRANSHMEAYRRFCIAQHAYEYCITHLNVHDQLTAWAALRADILYKKLLQQRDYSWETLA